MSAADVTREIDTFMEWVVRRNPGEPEFHQAVDEVVETLMPFVIEHDKYRHAKILQRMCEPDRIITFRVTWVDDDGEYHVNRAWRVQFNDSIGPYKGGLRFHPSVTLGTLKFLGFEQTFKNALTGLPMGGAKGGANFDPKGRSDNEVMKFCQSLMTELYRHIGENTDVPAGDIGVGAREIGYLFGTYKRLANRVTGVLTGKGLSFGGSRVRKEATGYGVVYFTEHMLERIDEGLEGKTAAVSGSGNVAIYTIEKLLEKGAKTLTISDSGGFVHDPDGIDEEKLAWLKDLKEVRRGRVSEYAEHFKNATFHAKTNPWVVPVDLAFPSATQNELTGADALTLVENGVIAVGEGEHADGARGGKSLRGREDLLRPGQGGQRGRRGCLRPGDESERAPPLLDGRAGGCRAQESDAEHPRAVRRVRRHGQVGELRAGRQRRGLRQGSGRHARVRSGLGTFRSPGRGSEPRK